VAAVAAAAAMLAFVFVVMLAGSLLLRAAGAADMPAPAAWVLGCFATSIGVWLLAFGLGWTAAAAFYLWTAAVAGLAVRFRRELCAERRLGLAEAVGLLLCAAATLTWCRDIAGASERFGRGEPLRAFVDFLLHAGVISQLGDPLAAGRGSTELVDSGTPLYHYASYALPAVFAAPLDLNGLTLSTAVWLPLGFFTLCAGAYVLGATLAGPAGGVAALCALVLVPDAASYGLQNGVLGFHWNITALPGGSYAVGFCLLAIAFLRRWMAGGGRAAFVAAAALVLGVALVRIHVFALAFPGLAASAALALPVVRRHKLLSVALALSGLVAFVLAFYATVPYAIPALERTLDNIHIDFEPTAARFVYREFLIAHSNVVALPFGVLLLLVGMLGAFLLLYPLSAWLAGRYRRRETIDLVPAVLFASYLLLLAFAPVSEHGDPTELNQRPFILLYAVLAVWTAVGFLRWLSAGAEASRRTWLVLLLAAGIGFPLIWPHAVQLGSQPRFKWGWQYYVVEPTPGVPQAAAFMRAHAQAGDVFAAPSPGLGVTTTDTATDLVALTGMPAYLSRPYRQISRGGRRAETARERHAGLERIAGERDAATALAALRAMGIRWYVVAGDAGPLWDPQRRQAAFVAGHMTVYSSR
jgi:hypothetical protein